jgi:hypothetical protein
MTTTRDRPANYTHTDTMEKMIMFAMPEQLARQHQQDLLHEAQAGRRARALVRMRRAERRAARLQSAARSRAAAAADARRAVAVAAQAQL